MHLPFSFLFCSLLQFYFYLVDFADFSFSIFIDIYILCAHFLLAIFNSIYLSFSNSIYHPFSYPKMCSTSSCWSYHANQKLKYSNCSM